MSEDSQKFTVQGKGEIKEPNGIVADIEYVEIRKKDDGSKPSLFLTFKYPMGHIVINKAVRWAFNDHGLCLFIEHDNEIVDMVRIELKEADLRKAIIDGLTAGFMIPCLTDKNNENPVALPTLESLV